MVGRSPVSAFVTSVLSPSLNAADESVSPIARTRSLWTVLSVSVTGTALLMFPSKPRTTELRTSKSMLIVSMSARTVGASRFTRGEVIESPMPRPAMRAINCLVNTILDREGETTAKQKMRDGMRVPANSENRREQS